MKHVEYIIKMKKFINLAICLSLLFKIQLRKYNILNLSKTRKQIWAKMFHGSHTFIYAVVTSDSYYIEQNIGAKYKRGNM